jgi:hypothetical protein
MERIRFFKVSTLIASGLLLGLALICTSSIEVFRLSAKLREENSGFEPRLQERLLTLRAEARRRANRYNHLLELDHLAKGMVVSRSFLGQITNICDSLLFSSLRYIALKKLGNHDAAKEAWQAIENSQRNGKWLRHPDCADHSTSRDMIVGVLAALTQKPPRYRQHLKNLIEYVAENDGYIGDGPFHVSRLTPGLAEIIRLMAEEEGLLIRDLPRDVRYGFSTLEFDTLNGRRGYTSHLNSLVIWVELELIRSFLSDYHEQMRVRSITTVIEPITDPLIPFSLRDQRMQWLTQRLVRLDPENLFFRWLQYRAANALTPKAEVQLLEELLSMPQFPPHRLPTTCERKADYLWQRDSVEYSPKDYRVCSEVFAGVDFMWMAALLQ